LPASRWNVITAAHLLNRAGFGGPPAAIAKLEKMGLHEAVDWLVDFEAIPDPTPKPDWAEPDPDRMDKLQTMRATRQQMRRATEPERAALEQKTREMFREVMRTQQEHIVALRRWWLDRMVHGPRPLQEKLTLFWHGHFATSAQKVHDAYLMWQQNEMFRRHAAGSWLTLLTEVTRDPAMLLWLDQAQSRREHPNENYAREVMELFTLGEGHYSEQDVAEAARAFTGLTLDRLRQVPAYRPFLHDDREKTVLGRTGRLTWTDVLEQIVTQPQADRFITAKLWRFFVSEDVADELVAALAALFRENNHEFKPVLRTLFRSEEFYADTVIRHQVKSPVQWLVNTVRLLERPLPPAFVASNLLQNLGQDLFAPPNVKGWDGGLSWITTNNLLARYNYAETLIFGRGGTNFNGERNGLKQLPNRPNRMPPQRHPVDVVRLLSPEERHDKTALIAALETRFLQGKLKPKQEQVLREYLDAQETLEDRDLLETIRLLMSTPEYQLC
jgi:hypothetical protein